MSLFPSSGCHRLLVKRTLGIDGNIQYDLKAEDCCFQRDDVIETRMQEICEVMLTIILVMMRKYNDRRLILERRVDIYIYQDLSRWEGEPSVNEDVADWKPEHSKTFRICYLRHSLSARTSRFLRAT